MPGFPDLTGRTVLVTGASSGLGAEFARSAAAAGASVALAARRLDRLVSLQAVIEAAGGKAIAVEMDVEDEASVIRGFDEAQAAIGPIMSVIANAGMNAPSSALGLPIDGFDKVVSINLRGAFLTAREAAKRMIAAGSPQSGAGRIVLVGSVGSHRVLDKLVAYNTTKAGVLMMGKALAKEWALKGINVNTVCPGWIKTELNTEWLETPAGQALIESFPRKRVMEPSDLADMVLFLLSDASRTVTGGGFELDDGQSL
ncbi:SDR family NAD(P)-dependent oxidoreductase [Novosphingobium taihuense]|uniref:NAD(P)-dependent dehydrogenase (Short-subunit alcohol dehydrogenase family) n=1 Tax=Novosphingobium taihuense TaxID=260085 RepID=A0A7W7ADM4_9SPHN|nr:SDR family oxidoreductase [Novosphingobium taihuense]MBB4615068.1 NAD(P)-dependent dehydrogenase (short-subunit alcohol dehydrogenase family) [Novosphingobium taihuense]TWH79301.1 NAD(P)-dependent dehydrogenase (short-subunit alcohol dehydrogenase family) [Novosphingobium taihuense]